jgi:Protein of unknown function (DUF1350)
MKDLTSTLARLDQQWKIKQRNKPDGGGGGRWTKLILPPTTTTTTAESGGGVDGGEGEQEAAAAVREVPASSSSSGGQLEDYVYLLEPPYGTRPSCLIVFTGGAGLGSYPHIAYNEFLLQISDRLNAAVITAPYDVGLDHFTLSKDTGDRTRRAILFCQDDAARQYPENLPVYALSHSLGSKLSCIYVAATNQSYDGIGFISFNNFSFGKTIGMAREFAETIRQNSGMMGSGPNPTQGISTDALDGLFSFAEMAVSAVGIDFSPSQAETERLISMRYDDQLARKTRLFTFDTDTLQNTQDFVNACSSSSSVPTVSELPGTHLTPVYFELGWDEMDLPAEAKTMAKEMAGGFQKASFGNKEELDALVKEVVDWIMCKPPSRQPDWLRERPQLPSSSNP